MIIAVDAMGGDHGVSVTVPAAFKALAENDDLSLILVGDQSVIEELIIKQNRPELACRVTIRHASQQVLMDELPSRALRNKKDSSLRKAVDLVKAKEADACVSAGNTGALVAISRFVLKMFPGIDLPAITTQMPTMVLGKNVNILDLGANLGTDASYLFQLAVMGSVLSTVVYGIPEPKVALLNIGSEEIKGNEQVKKAAQMLIANKNVNYVGFVEGDHIFKGEVDVIVCDGFTGNIVLKTIEGAMKLVTFYAKRNMLRNWFTKLTALLALPMLKEMRKEIDPGKYNGATLLGLNGIVVKSHGGADVRAFSQAILRAAVEAGSKVPEKIKDELARIIQT